MDEVNENGDAPGDRRLCFQCIGEPFLAAEVKKNGAKAACFYCSGERAAISIDELADRLQKVFDDHFIRTATEPSAFEYAMYKESDRDWEREGDPVQYVIADAAQIDEQPAEDARKVLDDRTSDRELDEMGDESPFDEEAHYLRTGVGSHELHAEWNSFERALKTETRFFNRSGEAVLDSIFEEVGQHKTLKGHPVVTSAGPGTAMSKLYRARAFQSDEKLAAALRRPDEEIGPPPPVAAVGGRMNARGIGVFYGATTAGISLAEVRPPIGSRVVVGRFEIIRSLLLLDVERLKSVYVTGSLFDPLFIKRLQKADFLERLSARITIPVMPDDEPFEYLVTQAIADYLAGKQSPKLDGIIYPSIQAGKGKNVVLFHKAARVEALDRPEGIEITASLYQHTDEGPEVEYYVAEEVPPPKKEKKSDHLAFDILPVEEPMGTFDSRDPALRLDIASLKVHHVKSVTFRTDSYPVHRHRSEKGKLSF